MASRFLGRSSQMCLDVLPRRIKVGVIQNERPEFRAEWKSGPLACSGPIGTRVAMVSNPEMRFSVKSDEKLPYPRVEIEIEHVLSHLFRRHELQTEPVLSGMQLFRMAQVRFSHARKHPWNFEFRVFV
jgi:hypothetical protein